MYRVQVLKQFQMEIILEVLAEPLVGTNVAYGITWRP